MNKNKIIILIIGLILIGLGIWFWLGRVDAKIISNTATMKRVAFGSEKTENAYVSLRYNADSQKYLYINIVIDFNKDGKIARYDQSGKTQEEWVVRNMDTKIFANEGGNYDIKLTDLNVDDQKDFPAQVILTKKPIKDWQGKKLRGSAYQTLSIPAIEVDDISTRFSTHPEGKGGSGFVESLFTPVFAQDEQIPNIPPQDSESDAAKTGEVQGQANQNKAKEKTIETVSKEFDVFNGDVPDITQGLNECGPTSVANSMKWLAKKNNFKDKLPISDKELIEEFKDDMKWDVNIGVLDENFIPGKKTFTSQHGIPIETHLVAAKDYDVNIMSKIAQELRKGQDVEIAVEYWEKQADGKWKVVGGHWMTAVGATGTRDSQTIFVHDPASPGPSLLDIYKVNGTRIIDYRYQGEAVTYIQYAVAESPITPPPPITPPDDSTPTNTPINATTNTPSPLRDPILSGDYSKTLTDDISQLIINITAKNLVEKTFNGLEIDHNAQGLPGPYDSKINLNQTGDDNSDWTCECLASSKYRCSGSDALEVNAETNWSLWFSGDINPPSSLKVDLLTDGEIMTSVNLESK